MGREVESLCQRETLEIVNAEKLAPWMEALVELYQEAYRGLEEYAYTRPRDIRNYLKWLHKRAPHSFFLALEGDRLLGFVVADDRWLEEGEPVGEIHEIVVSSRARSKGVGKALMEKALAHFREKGLAKAGLWVGVTNEKAHQFYKGLGFEDKGTLGRWIRMERPL